MKKLLTEPEMLRILNGKSIKYGQKEFADHLRVSAGYLCDVLKGRRALTGDLAAKLGYERIISFRSIKAQGEK